MDNKEVFYELVEEYKKAKERGLDTKGIAKAITAILDYEVCGNIVKFNPTIKG